jgi:hypothetical protein
MDKKRIGILRGGAGKHYEKSVAKGGEVISYVFENLSDKYRPIDLFVDKNNILHISGIPANLEDLTNKVDILWNASHPNFSNVLKKLPIPNIRNDSSSIIEKSRAILNKHIKNYGIKMPEHIVFPASTRPSSLGGPVYQKDFDGPKEKYAVKKAKEVLEKFGAPWIVRSFNPDSNMGVRVAKTFPELVDAIADGVAHKESILVEELIAGKNASVHSINNFRGENIYVLPPTEDRNGIIVSPGNFSADEKDKLIFLAKNLHEYLNMSHYSKFDFRLNPTRGVYLIKMEFLPDLKENSDFIQSCESVGAKSRDVLEHLLELSLNSKVNK